MLFGTFKMAGAFDGDAYESREGYQGAKYSLKETWQRRVPILLRERKLLLNPDDYRYGRYSKYRQAAREWVNG